MIDLRLGRWQDVLTDVGECDAVITDPPYSARVHDGQARNRGPIGYEALGPLETRAIVRHWRARAATWCGFFCDDALVPIYRKTARAMGFYDFQPVPVLQHKPRMGGDGPGSGAVYFVPSRPREPRMMQWGSLPGWYRAPPEHGPVKGMKPLALMRTIIRDYTRPGDLVVDPFCGGGTTALACAIEGRRCITSEVDPETYEIARARIARGYTPEMFR